MTIEGIGEIRSEYFSSLEGKLERIALSKSRLVTIGLFSVNVSYDVFFGLIIADDCCC